MFKKNKKVWIDAPEDRSGMRGNIEFLHLHVTFSCTHSPLYIQQILLEYLPFSRHWHLVLNLEDRSINKMWLLFSTQCS